MKKSPSGTCERPTVLWSEKGEGAEAKKVQKTGRFHHWISMDRYLGNAQIEVTLSSVGLP